MFWFIVIFIAVLVLSLAMMPKPQTAPPAGLGDIKAPTAEEGREIPVLFGTRDVEGPNCVGYWRLRAIPVKGGGGK